MCKNSMDGERMTENLNKPLPLLGPFLESYPNLLRVKPNTHANLPGRLATTVTVLGCNQIGWDVKSHKRVQHIAAS
jgi:hypothetical protein